MTTTLLDRLVDERRGVRRYALQHRRRLGRGHPSTLTLRGQELAEQPHVTRARQPGDRLVREHPGDRCGDPLLLGERLVPGRVRMLLGRDRKSTRLNSSHANISYAVFCLKKKKK